MKQRRRRRRITIRTEEFLTVRGDALLANIACPACGAHLSLDALASQHADSASMEEEKSDGVEKPMLLPENCEHDIED